jgi:ribose-phosphate pyrophosphokinase
MSMHRGMSVNLVDARVERFNDQEIFVEVFENVRGEDMYVIQPTSNPANDNLMELLIMTDALRRSSASRITAVIPYFGYARQDRRAKARTPITAKLVANMIETGVDRVLTLDLHAAQIQGFFDIPVDNLYASPVFALDIEHHFKGQMDDLMVVSPDVGGVARARELAKRINAPLAIVDKRREKAGEIAGMTVIGDVKGRKCIIVDDICDTAGTLCKAAETLMEAGRDRGSQLYHPRRPVRPGGGAGAEFGDEIAGDHRFDRAGRKGEGAKNIRIVPTAPMFAQAILNIWGGMSVSSLSLFETDTLVPIYEGLYLSASCLFGWPGLFHPARAGRYLRPADGPAARPRCNRRADRGRDAGPAMDATFAASAGEPDFGLSQHACRLIRADGDLRLPLAPPCRNRCIDLRGGDDDRLGPAGLALCGRWLCRGADRGAVLVVRRHYPALARHRPAPG